MVQDTGEAELYKRQFIGFVSLLANSAMQQLGKLANPFTGKVERNLEGARATIGMIKMLQVKTRGNLSPDEQQAIDSDLSTLQLNYVDELGRKDETAATAGEPASAEGSETPKADREVRADQEVRADREVRADQKVRAKKPKAKD